MDLREATPADVDGVREVARASLEASYGHALSAEAIEEAVERWYEADELRTELADDDVVFLVAVEPEGDSNGGGTGADATGSADDAGERTDDAGESAGGGERARGGGEGRGAERVVGFVQSYFLDRREPIGQLDWLHVDPEHRGHGIGTALLRRVEAEMLDRGATRIEGRVLVANESGTGFYAEEGFTAGPERDVEIGGETFRERLYTKFPEGDGEAARTGEHATPDGRTLFVAYDEAERASKAPFYATYADRERETREGYFCGNCESVAPLVDSMGTVECPECGNRRKPTRWDAAYL